LIALIRNPVWKNGPQICERFMLPAFESEKAARDFHEKSAPGTHVDPPFECACGRWHYASTAREPGGASNGGGRYAKDRDRERNR